MNKEKLTKIICESIADNKKEESKPFEFEVDKKIRGNLYLRATGKAEFYPSISRGGKGGMTTTEQNPNFTLQESSNKLKITISLPKEGLRFSEVMRVFSKLINHLQKSKLV